MREVSRAYSHCLHCSTEAVILLDMEWPFVHLSIRLQAEDTGLTSVSRWVAKPIHGYTTVSTYRFQRLLLRLCNKINTIMIKIPVYS